MLDTDSQTLIKYDLSSEFVRSVIQKVDRHRQMLMKPLLSIFTISLCCRSICYFSVKQSRFEGSMLVKYIWNAYIKKTRHLIIKMLSCTSPVYNNMDRFYQGVCKLRNKLSLHEEVAFPTVSRDIRSHMGHHQCCTFLGWFLGILYQLF